MYQPTSDVFVVVALRKRRSVLMASVADGVVCCKNRKIEVAANFMMVNATMPSRQQPSSSVDDSEMIRDRRNFAG
ncbi:MAG: hypothetical protein IAG10_00580 [Planctomycetaceae bacterium]|nr:hypothetical protein [Planctomycetaceae bacterium]